MTISVNYTYIKVIPSRIPGRMFDVYWAAEPSVIGLGLAFDVQYGEKTSGPWVNHEDWSAPVFSPDFSIDFSQTMPLIGEATGIAPIRSDTTPLLAVRLHAKLSFAEAVAKGIDTSGMQDLGDGFFSLGYSPALVPDHQPSWRDYRILSEFIRRENLALMHHCGFPGHLIKMRKISASCSRCVYVGMEEHSADPGCPECFGTGRVAPYHLPLPLLIGWKTRPQGDENRLITPDGRGTQKEGECRLLPVPLVGTGDLIIDGGTGVRFEVKTAQQVLYKVWPVAQEVTLVSIPMTKPQYKIAIPNQYGGQV